MQNQHEFLCQIAAQMLCSGQIKGLLYFRQRMVQEGILELG